jgi:copper(I)-binding protein
MLMELAEPLELGDTVELVLTLEAAGEVPVTVEVRDEAPTAG